VPSIIRAFDSYKIYHFAGRQPLERRMVTDWVPCFYQGKQIGSLNFMLDESDVQDNEYWNGQIKLYYHVDRFVEIVTTLRYESPLSLMIDTDTLEGALITKELEPVGEEESSHD
jgi:hypothetical protein